MPEEEAEAQADPGLQAMEEKWLRHWEEWGVYRFDPASGRPIFSIDTPPPTVSGRMHIGHAYSYNQMDFVARYKRMRGFELFYPFGFDDNGLPTERYTEKAVGKRLADVGRQEFIRLCLHETKKGEDEMERSWRRIGTSCDWSLVYRTIDKPVVKVSQHSFLRLHKEGRAYRAERPGIWCPECATAIAQVETEDKVMPSTFNDISFDLVDEVHVAGHGARAGYAPGAPHLVVRTSVPGPEANSKPREVITYNQGAEGRIVVSTTRPELIPACVAIFVHPDDERTRHLVGRQVRVPIGGGNVVSVLTSDKVDKETGTGVVMNCTFGDQTDIDWWAANNLPLRVVIGPKGIMNDHAGKYAGHTVTHARTEILADLNKEGRLLHQKHIEHAVNVHERCGTAVEFLVTKQWFVRYLDMRETFLARGAEVDWHPEYMRVRFDNWVKGLKWDWCISRQRYFGVPFPVWYCTDCGEAKVATVEELPVDPTADKPRDARCGACGGSDFRGETDVMDTWATSSLTPQIAILTAAERLGVPGATLDTIDTDPRLARMLPMSVRSQAHEIISFWAFNTVVKAHFHHGKIPWKDTMISGFVKLGKGKKMSKSKGDAVEPLEVIEEFSGDALRYWSATGANLGEDIIWNPKDLTRAVRLVTKLRNVQGLIARAVGAAAASPQGADERGRSSSGEKPAPVPWEQLDLADRWILAEYARVVQGATAGWEGYDYTRAVKDTESFLWHVVADHYLELVKHRIDKPGTRHTLYTIGLGLLKLMAPVLCFATEDLYQDIYRRHEGHQSIHVAPWPEAPRADASVLPEGAVLRDVVAAIRNWKSQSKLALNQALPAVEVVAMDPLARRALEQGKADLRGTVHVADVHFVDAKEVMMVPTAVEPVHAKLGPKFRQHAKAIADAVKAMDPGKAGPDGLDVSTPDGGRFHLEPGEYEVRTRPTLHGAEVDAVEVAGVTLLLRKP